MLAITSPFPSSLLSSCHSLHALAMPHLHAGPQGTRFSQTLLGNRVFSPTLQSPSRWPYFFCLSLPFSCPHPHVGLANKGYISLGVSSRAVSAVSAKIDEISNDEVSGGIYWHINQNPIFVKENPSWFTWQDYETIFSLCTASSCTMQNDFIFHKWSLAF